MNEQTKKWTNKEMNWNQYMKLTNERMNKETKKQTDKREAKETDI